MYILTKIFTGYILMRNMFPKFFNTSLRLGSLAIKLGLTLYMGRYLGLGELGTYGLVAACVAIAIPLLGFRFDYVVSRDIVDVSGFDLAHKMRDQLVFYGLSYLAMAVFLLALAFLNTGMFDASLILFILPLCILESLATITSSNLVSLKRPILANALFFMRASLWVLPVVAMGILEPSYRTANLIFSWWLGGVVLSLFVTACSFRTLPWAEVLRSPVDWLWIRSGVKKCFFIWLGAVGAAAASNIDRFVVEFFMGRDFVGIASFYGSFIIAITSLLSSGIFSFGYPQLISLYKKNEQKQFLEATKKMTFQAVGAATLLCILIGIAVPILGDLFDRPEFSTNADVLWLMLLGIWLKSATESLHYVLYARHQDRAIWMGSLLLLAITFLGNVLLVSLFGFIGIGYSALLSAVFLCSWRIYYFRYPSLTSE